MKPTSFLDLVDLSRVPPLAVAKLLDTEYQIITALKPTINQLASEQRLTKQDVANAIKSSRDLVLPRLDSCLNELAQYLKKMLTDVEIMDIVVSMFINPVPAESGRCGHSRLRREPARGSTVDKGVNTTIAIGGRFLSSDVTVLPEDIQFSETLDEILACNPAAIELQVHDGRKSYVARRKGVTQDPSGVEAHLCIYQLYTSKLRKNSASNSS
jgi:hypothetical protein